MAKRRMLPTYPIAVNVIIFCSTLQVLSFHSFAKGWATPRIRFVLNSYYGRAAVIAAEDIKPILAALFRPEQRPIRRLQ